MADANMSYLYTVGGYATLIGVGYALYHVSTSKSNRRAPTTSIKGTQQEPRKEEKSKKKQRMESFASDTQAGSKAKARSKPADEPVAEVKPVETSKPDREEIDNREFARQLAKAQEGTKFASKTEGSKQREKSVKQSRANQISKKATVEKSSAPSAPSSTTGADADDDQSPPSSPAAPPAAPADVSGVSDMLEPTPSGPSVLRVTDTGSQKQKPKQAKTPEKTETKKQRQNRKKAEAAKAAREDTEKERKALEEKQRRVARIAEGRAAKDGSQFMAANGANSAWTQGAPNGAGAEKATKAAVHQPLDTFEKPTAAVAKQPSAVKSEGSWISSLPSEEEQMEMLKDNADEWSTVKTKASKKALKKASSVSSGDEKAPAAAPAAAPIQAKQPAATASKQNKAPAPQNFGGSFSALTSNDDAAEEVEEEWDV